MAGKGVVGAMVRVFLLILMMVALPVNALSAASCCDDLNMEIQLENPPCHENQHKEEDRNQSCQECIFCMNNAFFFSERVESNFYMVVAGVSGNIPSFDSHDLRPPFKPPKAV